MIPVLERIPTGAEKFLGGIQQSLPAIHDLILSHQKNKMLKDILSQGTPQQASPSLGLPQKEEMFRNLALQHEQGTGEELQPNQLNSLWNQIEGSQSQMPQQEQAQGQGFSLSPEQYAAIAMTDPQMAAAFGPLFTAQQKAATKEEEIFAESAKEFWKDIRKSSEKLPEIETSLDAQLDAVLRGDVDPFSRGHLADIAKGLGIPSSITTMLETPGSKEFKTGLKTLLSSTLKEAFRGTTTGREIELAESLLAQAGTSKAGNLASIWLLQSKYILQKEKIRLAKEFRNAGYRPSQIPDLVDERIEPYRKTLSKQYMDAVNEMSKKK